MPFPICTALAFSTPAAPPLPMLSVPLPPAVPATISGEAPPPTVSIPSASKLSVPAPSTPTLNDVAASNVEPAPVIVTEEMLPAGAGDFHGIPTDGAARVDR